MSDDTYRSPVPQPVCAKCKHRADARCMDDERPWLDWFCLATPKELLREEYNPLTGVTTPAKMGYERCVSVNATGQCTIFEPDPEPSQQTRTRTRRAPPPPPLQTEPRPEPMPWWRRMLRGEG